MTQSADPVLDTEGRGYRRGWVHTHGSTLAELFRVTDAACLVTALWIACQLLNLPWDREQVLLGLMAVVTFNLTAAYWPLYRSWRASTLAAEMSTAAGCCVLALLIVLAVLFIFALHIPLGRDPVLLWGLLASALICTGRVVVRVGLRVLRARGKNFRTAAIVGATATAARVVEQLQHSPWMGIRLLGVYDLHAGLRWPEGPGIAGDLSLLKQHIDRGEVDIVYIAMPFRSQRMIQRVMRHLRDSAVSVQIVADFSGYQVIRPRWEMLGSMPTISLVDSPHQGVDGALKRAMDVALAAIALVGLAVPMLVISVAIKLTSPGQVAFVQNRHGLGGREFGIYKFRTMTVVEDGSSAFTQASRGDRRISPIGAFLRRFSLDELPQLVNVLLGHMSLVGPRPHPVALNQAQRKIIDGYMLRHMVRPGITGWAQINGCRGVTDTREKMENRVRYDLEYINNWSLWLDIRILWKTLLMVLRDPNAF